MTGKINVVHVTQYLEIGGLESFIVEFAKKMNRELFKVRVLCLNGCDADYCKSLAESGIKVELIRKRTRYDLGFFLRAAAFLREHRTDVVHAHGGCFLYSAVIARLAGVRKLVYTVHGMPVVHGFQARVEELIASVLTDRIVAVSEEIACHTRERVRLCRGKVITIINGIDPAKFAPVSDPAAIAKGKERYGLPRQKMIVGSVGRLEPVKNYALLLKAFAELIHSYHAEAHLVLVGDGSERPSLQALAEELSVGGHVSFLGMQYDLPGIYPLFDVFALSSLTEGTSISLLEAQACGIPAVVTAVGGNPQVITDGVNGLLCPSGDHAAMAARLFRLVTEAATHAAMKGAARQAVVRGFDLSHAVNAYEFIYRDGGSAPGAALAVHG